MPTVTISEKSATSPLSEQLQVLLASALKWSYFQGVIKCGKIIIGHFHGNVKRRQEIWHILVDFQKKSYNSEREEEMRERTEIYIFLPPGANKLQILYHWSSGKSLWTQKSKPRCIFVLLLYWTDAGALYQVGALGLLCWHLHSLVIILFHCVDTKTLP